MKIHIHWHKMQWDFMDMKFILECRCGHRRNYWTWWE